MPPTGGWQSIWAAEKEDYDSPHLMLDCLLPTGIIVQLSVRKDAQIKKIKEELWQEAQNYPLFRLLKRKNAADYVFICINEMAERVELEDETRRLCDVRPFHAMLKLMEKCTGDNGSSAEKVVQSQISGLIGKRVDELAGIKSAEVIDFRKHMHELCERTARDRDNQDLLARAKCFYPPDVTIDPELPPHLRRQLSDNGMLMVLVHVETVEVAYTLLVAIETTYPKDLIQMALKKRTSSGVTNDNPEKFVLKVCGREEYFLGEYPLSQFKYVRKMMTKNERPELLVVDKHVILDSQNKPSVGPRRPGPVRPPVRSEIVTPGNDLAAMAGGRCLYDLKEPFAITVVGVSNVVMQDFSMVNVRGCLYHGWEMLGSVINSPERRITEGATIQWNEPFVFDVSLTNLPRMARLCFMLYTSSDRRENNTVKPGKQKGRLPTGGGKKLGAAKDVIPLAWVNIPIFDYKGVLRSGEHKLYMWPITDEDILSQAKLNPIGTVESNPQTSEAVCLKIEFHRYNLNSPIYYPHFAQVLEVAATFSNFENSSEMDMRTLAFDPQKVTAHHLEQLRQLVERDPLHVEHEQDKELIWSLRHECREHFPQSLPKVLACVHWDDYVKVALMQALLQIWTPLSPTAALLLLDFEFADKSVRAFAIKCLADMSDSELAQYLLQFVQALKYESYLECDLIEFLLKRALMNQKIGHQLFWLLRAEMHIPSVAVRFGLILEAYCRGNIHYLDPLTKQVDAVKRLEILADIMKKLQLPKDKLRDEMVKILKNSVYQNMLSQFSCPLDSSLRLKDLDLTKCRTMDSKMRPLWLVWKNADPVTGPTNSKIYVMYKKGDDLRQDMLSLQILRIMDNMWQAEGLDLRLSAYGCLTTGHDEGLIEIVTEATTIANIQLGNGGITKAQQAFNKVCLYQWLEKKNQTPEGLEKALEEFLLSCAGYCVATYVLGVADRHSDNIMLRNNGQLFHIDFGHILGHYKSKYGVKRERVPFVLTSDFVYVIKKGRKQDDESFARFRDICERAFLILRVHSNFLITLFLMMMNTGIPEVSSLEDIEYLRGSLVPHKTDEEAIAHFRSKFQEALHYSWKASLNNVFHLARVGGN